MIRLPLFLRSASWIRAVIPAVPCLALVLLLLAPAHALAQGPPVEIRVANPGEVQEVVLRDGSVLYGQVLEAGDTITFRLLSGLEMRFSNAQVRSIRTARGDVVDGEYWPPDPNRTRLFFGPTARGLPKGDGYLAVYEIIMPFLGVALSDRFILAGGTPLLFGGGGSRPFWLAPKLTVLDTGRTQAALGILAFAVEDHSAGVVYGVVTRGGAQRSGTVGLGYGYVDDDLAEKPAVMLGGEIRIGRRTKLVTENYLFPGGAGLISLGPRFFGERLSADLGLALPVGGGDSFVFPLINFVWNF